MCRIVAGWVQVLMFVTIEFYGLLHVHLAVALESYDEGVGKLLLHSLKRTACLVVVCRRAISVFVESAFAVAVRHVKAKEAFVGAFKAGGVGENLNLEGGNTVDSVIFGLCVGFANRFFCFRFLCLFACVLYP